MIFSGNIIGQVFLTDQKLEMNMPQFFKTTFIANFRKYKTRKKNWWSKNWTMKSNWKNWRTGSRVPGSRMPLECVVSVVQK